MRSQWKPDLEEGVDGLLTGISSNHPIMGNPTGHADVSGNMLYSRGDHWFSTGRSGEQQSCEWEHGGGSSTL